MTETSIKTYPAQEHQCNVPSRKQVYSKPQIISLGSLEKVQANYGGSAYDGPDKAYYYR